MKLLVGTWIVLMAIIVANPVSAEISANIGWAGVYYYRGIYQAESSANGASIIRKADSMSRPGPS